MPRPYPYLGYCNMPTEKTLVIWGASGHALVVADIVRLRGEYQIAGFLDSVNPGRVGAEFGGATILGGVEQLPDLVMEGVGYTILAIGDCDARLRLSEVARAAGLSLATAIHPSAIIAGDVQVGEGTVIAAGAMITPAARIGENVIINTSASIGHECIIEDGVHIGPGVHLGGRTTVGRGTWIGIGAAVSDRVTIGAHSVIGAGAVVVRDIPDGVVAYGVPARVVRRITEDVQ
jgi:UDP-N-acetylbacillosamine N-acetyltransferase